MPRIKVVPRIRVGRLIAMAFVLGLAVGLLTVRLLPSTGYSRPLIDLLMWFPVATLPAGLLLPFFDQRFRKQVWYTAAASAAAVCALTTDFAAHTPVFGAPGITSFLLCWLVGVLAAGLGLLISRACYRLVIQDGTLCPRCAYRLIGLPSQVCPECGREFTYEELGTTPERLEAGATEVEEESES